MKETVSRYGCRFNQAHTSMTTLDDRLYAWLLESDERQFELAFKSYFDVAYPSVVRRLVRLSRWDPLYLEELAQDALLRFFDKVGRKRREASEAVRISLSHIRPLNFGNFHESQVVGWTTDVGLFRDAAISFRPPGSDNTDWKTSIRALAERIPVLQREGLRLLHSVHLELRWTFDDVDSASSREPETDLILDQSDDVSQVNDHADPVISGTCEEHLVEEMLAKSARAVIAEKDHPGATSFVQGTWTIVRALPRLRVPTNGYLFDIAVTIYLDECKKRARQKRGGAGVFTADPSGAADRSGIASNHPIERMTLESFAGDDGERFDDSHMMAANCTSDFNPPSVDPTSQYENDDLFEKFYEYLRRPVDDAMNRFHQAQKNGRAVAERRKLDSLTSKFFRTMSVLSEMGEGYTQEQTAERLGLSRNQVRYIVESVQEIYSRFAADFVSPPILSKSAKEDSHVN
jgi:DNA-directed RNA polymerase specialized sigma24 family protein